MDDATLVALDAAAHAGSAHPVDVIRLVDEVRELNDRIRTLEKTVALPDTTRLVEFEAALSKQVGTSQLPILLRDPTVLVVRDAYARSPRFGITDALAWLVLLLWRDKVAVSDALVERGPPDDDTGEFVPVASIVATATGFANGPLMTTDWQGRRLVPTTDPVDGANVVVTDRGPMRYDPPVVIPTVDKSRAAFGRWMSGNMSRENLYTSAGLPVPPVPTPPSTGYADPTKTYVPQWDWKPGESSLANLAIPDLLSLLQEPTPLSRSMYEELIAELDRRGYKLGGSTPPSVSSKVPDGDAPTIVEK